MTHDAYMISKRTKAILSYDSPYYKTRVFEGEEMKPVSQHPKTILQTNCIQYGSSLQGRLEFVKNVLDLTYKLPVPVCPRKGIFLFPTASVRRKECVWLAFCNIKMFYKSSKGLYIEFMDQTGLSLDISENVLTQQYRRTARLMDMMERWGDDD